MTAAATGLVWAHSKATGSTLLVLLAMADYTSVEGTGCRLSINSMSRMARVSESTTHRALRWLIENGEIEVVGTDPDYNNTNIYAFTDRLMRGVNLTPPPLEGGVTGEPEGVSPVTPNTRTNPTTTAGNPPTTPSRSVTREEVRGMMTNSWRPSVEATNRIMSTCKHVDLASATTQFRGWYIANRSNEVKTQAQWDGAWEAWIARREEQWVGDHQASNEEKADPVTGMPKSWGRGYNIIQPGQPVPDERKDATS